MMSIRSTGCLVLVGLWLLSITILGCTKERQSTPNALGQGGVFQHAQWHNVTTRPYVIDPPDEIIITAARIPELNAQRRTVQPDGRVVLPLIGPINLAGQSPEEARQTIISATSRFYSKPEVEVDIVAQSKFYYVFGQGAARPGAVPYIGRVTVVKALADAGLSSEGWPQQVWLSRPGRDGADNATVVIDFTRIEDYGDLTQNYLIEEGDIIKLPMSPLASWNFKLNRVLSPLLSTVNAIDTPARVGRTYDDLKN